MRGDRTLLHLLAPITEPLNHPDVTDIVVNEPHRVGVRRRSAWGMVGRAQLRF